MVAASTPNPDGRHARRERNRAAVIDAMFALLRDGHIEISAEALAERSGLSVSSIFRYFDGLEDLAAQTLRTHFARHAELFEIGPPDRDSTTARIATLVDSRLRLYAAIEPIGRSARARAATNPQVADALQSLRERFARQIRDLFAVELGGRSRAEADDAVAVIDALTSFESWDLLRSTHGRSERLVRRAWVSAIAALLA